MTIPSPTDNEAETERDLLRRIGRKVRKRLAANPAAKQVVVEDAELWTLPRFFDAVECGRLMSIIDGVARPSTIHDLDRSRIRTSYSGDVDPRDPFIRKLQRRIDSLLGIEPTSGETMQGQRYLPGQEFKPHTDWFWQGTQAWANEWPNGGQRSFTAMAYLNDVEAGGETHFPELGIAVRPRAGMLLVWNNADDDGQPNMRMIHAGMPVIRGTKYIVTKWYRVGRWS